MRDFIAFSCALMVLSVPFCLIGQLSPVELPFGLPITSLMILVPAGVATIMAPDRTALWQVLFNLGRVPWAIVAALLLMPAVLAVARRTSGRMGGGAGCGNGGDAGADGQALCRCRPWSCLDHAVSCPDQPRLQLCPE